MLLFCQYCIASEQRTFKDFESFKDSLYIGINEKRSIDINNDGIEDIIVFSYGGEETFLTLLIKKDDHFVETGVPVGLEYDILNRDGNYYLKVGKGTFPMFGDIHGPDKYNWYDFYKVEGTTLISINDLHASFHKEMIEIYKSRISEIKREIELQRKDLISRGDDQEFVNFLIGFKSDQIVKYREFINRANEIVPTVPTKETNNRMNQTK